LEKRLTALRDIVTLETCDEELMLKGPKSFLKEKRMRLESWKRSEKTAAKRRGETERKKGKV
jgi:hypothetical protein